MLTDTCVTHTSHNTAPDCTAIHSEKLLPSRLRKGGGGGGGVGGSDDGGGETFIHFFPALHVDVCGLDRGLTALQGADAARAQNSGVCAREVACHI